MGGTACEVACSWGGTARGHGVRGAVPRDALEGAERGFQSGCQSGYWGVENVRSVPSHLI